MRDQNSLKVTGVVVPTNPKQDSLRVESAPVAVEPPQTTLTDEEHEAISALEATLSPSLHAAAMVSAFIAGQTESSLFDVLEELARARCTRVSATNMHTQLRAAETGLAYHLKFGLAYHLYDSSLAPAEKKAENESEGVWSMPTTSNFKCSNA